jgi:hypothetical protein
LNHSQTIYKRNIMTIQNAPGFAPKSNSGKGFTPTPKTDRPAETPQPAPTVPAEQVGITIAHTQDAALQRVQESRDSSGALVDALMTAAQQQASLQAQAIAAYPALVDQLTVNYLEQMGVSEAGKSTPVFDLVVECPQMESFTALLTGTTAPKQLSASA